MTALYIGRFQPFHNGHLDALKQIFSREKKVIIAIGSAEDNYLPENPFTAGERFEMIEGTLSALKTPKADYSIIPIRNINNFSLWPKHVEILCPSFDKIYTGSDLVRELFEKWSDKKICGIEIKLKITGTEIREKILKGENYQKLVPDFVYSYLEKIRAANRLKKINLSYKNAN